MQKRESVLGENPPSARVGHLLGESQTPPTSLDRVGLDEAGTRAQWGDFLLTLPEAAHVASAAPSTSRVGSPMSFQTEAATRFALGGIDHGEKVLVIGSRWQYLDILRGLRELMQDFGPARSQSSWRNRDLTVFPGDAPMMIPPA